MLPTEIWSAGHLVDGSSSYSEIPDYRGDAFEKEGIVSERHGDKARFAKQRQSKILRRKRLRELSKALTLEKKTPTIQAEPK
jgi:hypothetical protein